MTTTPDSARFTVGASVDPRELTTIRGGTVPLPDPDRLVHLQFRRFAGCPVCNLHLRSVAARHDEIRAAGVREVVLFHSAVRDMLPYQGDLPFDAVADPLREVYSAFGVGRSVRALLHPRAFTSPLRPSSWSAYLKGVRNGARLTGSPDGDDPIGLPGDFLIGPEGRIRALKYGAHAADQWSVDELLELARHART
ncbi:peroxiredoxin [Nocardiopsis sp. Huas11]|uniref:peroxiredoxin-like family protein n=1 Tax=Nocardiopsis sp. Huas11 TaxID=2183912 RepID=UPI000EACC117|nr:peroxiredoxin-like family protein [Nocardiopsis sp. Huas11]RKS06234.1 peroxiredoxin [Nocardiopsis sp. Huas11]